GGADGELDQHGRSAPPDLVWEARGIGLSVPIVQDRVQAGVVAKPDLDEDRVGPGLGGTDREVGRAVADHRAPHEILQLLLGAAHVVAELAGRLTVDVLVPLPVAGALVALPRDGAPARGVLARRPAE